MNEHQISRYLELINRRLYIILHSGIDWKPEYQLELNEINKELAKLRKVIDAIHNKEGVIYG